MLTKHAVFWYYGWVERVEIAASQDRKQGLRLPLHAPTNQPTSASIPINASRSRWNAHFTSCKFEIELFCTWKAMQTKVLAVAVRAMHDARRTLNQLCMHTYDTRTEYIELKGTTGATPAAATRHRWMHSICLSMMVAPFLYAKFVGNWLAQSNFELMDTHKTPRVVHMFVPRSIGCIQTWVPTSTHAHMHTKSTITLDDNEVLWLI